MTRCEHRWRVRLTLNLSTHRTWYVRSCDGCTEWYVLWTPETRNA